MKKIIIRFLFISFYSLTILSCQDTRIQPQWNMVYSASSNHYDTLSFVDILPDSEDLYLVGNSKEIDSAYDEIAALRLSADGKIIWKKSFDIDAYDRPLAHVIDTQQNLYIASENSVIKLNPQGELLWTVHLSEFVSPPTEEDPDPSMLIRDMKLYNDQIYVAGRHLILLNTDGAILQNIKFEKPIWQIYFKNNILYSAGNGLIQAFNSDNFSKTIFRYQLVKTQNPPAAIAVNDKGTIFVATRNDNPQDSAYLTAISAQGKMIWSKFYDDIVDGSYDLPGTPKLLLLNNNNLVLCLSQHPTRSIQWISSQDGHTINKYIAKTGIVQDMKNNEKDFIIASGGKNSQLFDAQGNLLATGNIQQDVDQTSGSIINRNNQIYIGSSIFINGSSSMSLRMYKP